MRIRGFAMTGFSTGLQATALVLGLSLGAWWMGSGSLGRNDSLAAFMALADARGQIYTQASVHITQITSVQHLAIHSPVALKELQLYRFEGRLADGQAIEGFLLGRSNHHPQTLQIGARVVQARGFTAQGAAVLLGEARSATGCFGFVGYRPGAAPVAFIEQGAIDHNLYLRDTHTLRFNLGSCGQGSPGVAALIGL